MGVLKYPTAHIQTVTNNIMRSKIHIFTLIVLFATKTFGQDPVVILNPIIDSEIINNADSLLNLKQFQKAIENYTTVIELSPQKQYPWAQRGFAYLNQDRYELALNDFDGICEDLIDKFYQILK
jgi:tetratricopeptide (TPR) repeat protein